jgi:SAM-dependent methyltransferase
MENGYREDLAAIHDVGFGGIAEEAAAFLLSRLSSAGLARGTVTDLGCGGGRLLRRAVDTGYEAVGVDLSAPVIQIARARVPEGEFHVESYLSCALPRSVAVTAIGEVLSYAFDERNTDAARDALFARAYSALVPGGLLLFDLATRGKAGEVAIRRGFRTGPGWAILFDAQVDGSVLIRRITSFRRDGACWRRDDETHRLLLADPVAVSRALRNVGFAVRTLAAYGTTALPPNVTVFLATRANDRSTRCEAKPGDGSLSHYGPPE